MHYWNKTNFQGLLAVADSLQAHPELKALASYCRYREQGLRRQAFAELERFLAASRSFDNAIARGAAIEILEANMRTSGAHQFLTQPLVARFLRPTLQDWMEDDAEASLPVRWLGMLDRDAELLTRALSACPEDLPVRKILIDFALGWVDHATHHLDESVFLGSPEEAILALERAKGLIAEAADPEALDHLRDEVRYFEHLVADWKAFLQAPTGSFPEWCSERGRDYAMPVKFYYER
ncbi:hypothetical protein [Pseudomonas sp. UBA6562]|uniref:hypothetical protein n=1 Tax=Pseudomonas sp. UBA6562 TaxID=1947332 RepID=UPI0025DC23D2|nr:hypothetical protein [Pseudomonas sp. UBA6562]